jgi:hypothetical protein
MCCTRLVSAGSLAHALLQRIFRSSCLDSRREFLYIAAREDIRMSTPFSFHKAFVKLY